MCLALRQVARSKGCRPKQVLGLTRDLLEKMLLECPDTLAGKRDAALLSVGYDTLCRSSELSWMNVEDVWLGEARIYIPRLKSDPYGDGRFAWISEVTAELVESWIRRSGINTGLLFRGLHTGVLGSSHLETSSIRRLMKAAARRAGLRQEAKLLSDHSMRVGAAQDMLRSGCDTLAIMTAGGWRNVEVVSRYVELAYCSPNTIRREFNH